MKVISLVTGASSGLGRDIATLLCRKGHIVYVIARRKEKLQELKKICAKEPGEIRVSPGDLTDIKVRERLISKIIKEEKKIDYLINNAGYGTAIEFEKQPLEDINKMFELNCVAGEHLISMALPYMKKKNKGKIINISSVVVFTPLPYFATYNATKSAIYNFTKSLRYELIGTGISASAVFPARMKTGFANQAFKCYSPDPKAYSKCVKEWDNMAGSSMKVAKGIVRTLNSRRLTILPTFGALMVYLISYIPFLMSSIRNYIMAPKMKANISQHKMDMKYYKK